MPPSTAAIATAPAVTLKLSLLKLARPRVLVDAVGIALVVTAVTRPLALTVIAGTEVLVPNEPTLLLTFARVIARSTAALPLNATPAEVVASPLTEKLREFCRVVAVAALPERAP